MSNHHKFSPSTFPALEKCMHYESSSESSEDAQRGTLQHSFLEHLINWNPDKQAEVISKLKPDEIENVRYVFEKVREIIGRYQSETDGDIIISGEKKVAIRTTDLSFVDGTMDVSVTADSSDTVIVIDAKFGTERDYSGQLKVYALGAMQSYKKAKAESIIIYGQEKQVISESYGIDEVQNYFDDMMEQIKTRDDVPPAACDYCKWCKHGDKCVGRNSAVMALKSFDKDASKQLMLRLSDKTNLVKMESERLGNLVSYLKIIGDFQKRLEEELKRRLSEGEDVPGWKLQTRKGARSFENTADAVHMLMNTVPGLTPDTLYNNMTISVGKAMDLLYGADAKKKASKDNFEERFDHLTKRAKDSVSLKKA